MFVSMIINFISRTFIIISSLFSEINFQKKIIIRVQKSFYISRKFIIQVIQEAENPFPTKTLLKVLMFFWNITLFIQLFPFLIDIA